MGEVGPFGPEPFLVPVPGCHELAETAQPLVLGGVHVDGPVHEVLQLGSGRVDTFEDDKLTRRDKPRRA